MSYDGERGRNPAEMACAKKRRHVPAGWLRLCRNRQKAADVRATHVIVRRRCWSVGCLLMSLLLLCSAADGQTRQPRLSLVPFCDSPRSHAPIQCEARLVWDYDDLLEGRLQLDFYVDTRRVHSWVSRELVLSNSEVNLAVMVPPVILPDERNVLNVIGTFVSEKGTFRYELDLPHWVDWKRVCVIGVVHPPALTSLAADFKSNEERTLSGLDPFRLETKAPDPNFVRSITSRIEALEPGHVPSSPLEMCGFDVLVISGAGLDALKARQLDAIAAWVEAGGAACIAGQYARTSEQRRFLERMLESTAVEPLITFDAEGRTLPLSDERLPWRLASPGIGRTLVTFEPVDVESPRWQQAVLTLWRMRARQVRNVIVTRKWSFKLPDVRGNLLFNPFYHPLAVDTAAEPDLQGVLMPERIEGVPFERLALLLVVCLLAIGPGDYFLLSWLRLRRWTWLLFPSVAIGFAVYTVRLAQSHMGKTDYRGSLTFVDVADDGRPVRRSRFELMFAASEHPAEQELDDVYAAPVEVRWPEDASLIGDLTLRSHVPTGIPNQLPATIAGRLPLKYEYVRYLRQWEPHLTRFTFIPLASDGRPALPIPWERIGIDSLSSAERREELIQEIESALAESQRFVEVRILHREESLGKESGNNLPALPTSSLPISPATRIERVAEMAATVSAREKSGIFQVLTQLSPNGAGNFEDLALLDRADASQWLLLIIVGDGKGSFTVYRQLFREGE